MAKQEFKILEFHGGTNDKFDPRDILDNQNALSQLSIRNPGRIVLEGSGTSLYDKTRLNHRIINNWSSSGAWESGHGLFTFPHDYNMDPTPSEIDTDFIVQNDQTDIDIYDPNSSNISTNIIQDGTDPNPADSNWTRRDASGNADGWTEADPPAYEDDETASLISTLGGDKIDAGFTYSLTFTVGTAALSLLIGGDDNATGSSNLPSQTFIAKKTYQVGTHTVHFQATVDRSHLWFTADTDSAGNGTLDNITCYRTGWTDAKFTLGSKTADVKPEYYNVDGALRTVDSNFSVTSTVLLINMGSGVTKNDITLTHDSGTINAGSTIQINQEIMYVVTSPSSTTITVIRGYANTKITTHANDSIIYYVNVPKYFGHIKEDRLFEAATSNSINTWVEDVQTPQPPNNTRKSDGTTATLASSAGVQSLRIYDEITGSTTNIPTESEKVVLEFGDDAPDYGIIKVEMSGDYVKITTSAEHGLTNGDEIVISNTNSAIPTLNGTHEVHGIDGSNAFLLNIEDYDTTEVEDYSDEDQYSGVTGWADYKDTVAGTVKVDVNDADTYPSGQFWIHITGQTGVTSFNGVKLATRVDGDEFYFKDANHGDVGDVAGTDKIQQLLATITRPGENAIDEDLKRKWNFAMSFTYDGPAQEVQESLLTQGYKITESAAADGTANELAADMNDTTTTNTHNVDDASVFTANESVIMVGSEQMLVTGVDTGGTPHIDVIRGYNGSTAATHSNGEQILLVEELTPTATVDWTGETVAKKAVIKSVYGYGVDEKSWNPRINGFKIYMKDVTDGSASQEWRLFSKVNLSKGTYQIFASDDSELILEQPASNAIATITSGTSIKIQPIDTYLSENLFTEQTLIDAQYKCAAVVGRVVYIGNIRQGGRTYPDRMLKSPVNKFDTFPETNYIDVAIGDGDSIIKLISYGDRLLQYKKKKLYIINVSGGSEVLESEHENAGIRYPSHVCKTNNGVCWFNESGLWFFDGRQVVNLTRNVSALDKLETGTRPGFILFEKFTNRVIFLPQNAANLTNKYYMYDFELQAYQSYFAGSLFPISSTIVSFPSYSNVVSDTEGISFLAFTDSHNNPTVTNFFKWTNSPSAAIAVAGYNSGQVLWKSKDFDFGSPAINKKIYKVYVTYKCTGVSGIDFQFATDASGSFSSFSSTKVPTYAVTSGVAQNYDVRTPASGVVGGGFLGLQNTVAGNFTTSDENWRVAELTPDSPISNIKSIQFQLKTISFTLGTNAQATNTDVSSPSTQIRLAASEGTYGYVGRYINIYSGSARYNNKLITAYNSTTKVATVSEAWNDNGYGAFPDTTSNYFIGSAASNFEINDITVVFRPKRVK